MTVERVAGSPARPATARQVALVHVARRALHLDESTYRDVLARFGRCASATELDAAGMDAVMAHFEACGFRPTGRGRPFGDRRGMATPRQVDAIRALWREWSGEQPRADLDRWLERSFGVSALRFLDRDGAQKAITGLRAMIGRRDASSGGAGSGRPAKRGQDQI